MHCRHLGKGKLEPNKPATNTTTKKQKKQNSKSSDDNESSKDIGVELITFKFWARAIDDDSMQTGVATVTAVGVFEADDEDWDTAEYEYHDSISGTLVCEEAMIADVTSWVEKYVKDVLPPPPVKFQNNGPKFIKNILCCYISQSQSNIYT